MTLRFGAISSHASPRILVWSCDIGNAEVVGLRSKGLELMGRSCHLMDNLKHPREPPAHDCSPTDSRRKPHIRGRCRQAPAPHGALGLFGQSGVSARADLERDCSHHSPSQSWPSAPLIFQLKLRPAKPAPLRSILAFGAGCPGPHVLTQRSRESN
jgi:hypothetical protein